MNDAEIAAIEEHIGDMARCVYCGTNCDHPADVGADITLLLTEVKRLRAEVAGLELWREAHRNFVPEMLRATVDAAIKEQRKIREAIAQRTPCKPGAHFFGTPTDRAETGAPCNCGQKTWPAVTR